MAKKLSVLLLAVCLLLLPACQSKTAEESTPAPEQSAAAVESEPLPTDSEPLPTEGGKTDTFPWDPPEEGEPPSYEEYFAQARTYEPLDRRWALSVDGYRLHQEGSHLYMMDSHTRELLWEIVELDDMEVVSADERWVYLIVGGTELIRMDHLGENRETLFTDETGLISRMNQSDYDNPGKVYYDIVFDDGPPHPSANNRSLAVADRKVLYFWAGADVEDAVKNMLVPASDEQLPCERSAAHSENSVTVAPQYYRKRQIGMNPHQAQITGSRINGSRLFA